MDAFILRVIRHWIPLAIGISMVCSIVYLVVQQDIRIGAYDPQIQMAEDMAASLNNGKTLPTSEKIDIAQSLAPFYIIFDQQGKVTASTALLNDKVPTPPSGVLISTKGTKQPGENRLTWQPQEGVRLATIVKKYNNGSVLVGRNMREAEIRIENQFGNIFIGWAGTLFVTLFSVLVMDVLFRKKK